VIGQFSKSAGLGILAAVLAGCGGGVGGRDPASEAPVAMKAGLYEITKTGEAMGMNFGKSKLTGKPEESKFCVNATMVDRWPVSLVKRVGVPVDECSHRPNPRVGNGLSGAFVCAIPEGEMPGAKVTISYSGDMAETSTSLDLKLTLDDALVERLRAEVKSEGKNVVEFEAMVAAMKLMSVNAVASRLGDCP
jgi:hypothetical protein